MSPRARPLDNGLLIIDNGRVADIGPWDQLRKTYSGPIEDLGASILVPGLINAHSHLELSHLQGQTTLDHGFETWVSSLLSLPMKEIDEQSLASAIDMILASGTACVADVTGHSPRRVLASLKNSRLEFRLFLEFLGFSRPKTQKPAWPEGLNPNKNSRLGATGHALYSTHPSTLQQIKTWSLDNNRTYVMHLAEHPGEFDLLTTGRGDFAEMISSILLPDDYVAPGLTPVAYADRLGLLDSCTLAVHCVRVTDEDIQLLADRRVSVCLCPRSNALINVGRAPWEKLHEQGVPLCLGTDSLASNQDLDMWAELEYLAYRWEGPPLSLAELLKMVTVNPARALKLEDRLGTLEKGKLARFSLVPERLAALPFTDRKPG
jgi:cytosine/adenosine deaminase-related metal-dependent hydrolase